MYYGKRARRSRLETSLDVVRCSMRWDCVGYSYKTHIVLVAFSVEVDGVDCRSGGVFLQKLGSTFFGALNSKLRTMMTSH